MDDFAPTEFHPTKPKGYESLPYLNHKRRVTRLWPELKALGLETHVAQLAVQGYTVGRIPAAES